MIYISISVIIFLINNIIFQMSSTDSWHALESDPDLWGAYMEKLGVDGNSLDFVEIYSLDEDYPPDKSIYSFVFLYPCNSSSPLSNVSQPLIDDKLWTIKQVEDLDSCCCLIALLHAIGNNLDKVTLKPNSPLADFFEKTKSMTADERAEVLLNDTKIHEAHEETAEQGQTEMVDGDRVGYHYIAYIVSKSNKLYELNGSTKGPQAKFIGELNEENFYVRVTREIKQKVNELDGDIRFNLIGLAKK
jgi:ubiquitin carboxyl-terminal hydrolase L3